MKSKFEINGIQCEYDFLDADKFEAYENMLQKLKEQFEEEEKKPVTSRADQMRKLCGYVKAGLSELFPNVEEMLPGNNYGECLEAIAIMSKAQTDAESSINAHLHSINAPNGDIPMNRAARRRHKRGKR